MGLILAIEAEDWKAFQKTLQKYTATSTLDKVQTKLLARIKTSYVPEEPTVTKKDVGGDFNLIDDDSAPAGAAPAGADGYGDSAANHG